MLRIIAYVLIAFGILLLVSAGYDEFRGSTSTPTSEYNPISDTITKTGNPEVFHNAMAYHWFYASMLLMGGVIAYVIDKGQDRVDPMSSDADENIDDELRKDEMDEELKEEKNNHPAAD